MSKSSFTLISFILLLGIWTSAAAEPVLHIDRLVHEALEKNPEIAGAHKRFEAAREKVPQAGALDDPMLGFGVVNLPSDFDINAEDMTMKEVSVSQKFPFPGKRPLMRAVATEEAEAVSAEVEQTANEVVKNVKIAFYDLSHIYRAMEVTRRNKEILEDFASITQSRYSLGQGIQEDVIRVQVEISRMVDELIMLEQKKSALEAKLNFLLNRPSTSPLGQPEEFKFNRVDFTIETLQRSALEENPALKALKNKIESRQKNLSLTNKDYLPDFSLKFAYGQREDRLNMYTGMVEMNVPIFVKSKQARKKAEALAELQAEEARYEATQNELFYMIADMGSMAARLEKQIELYTTGIIPQSSLQIQTAMSAYMVNKADFMTLLDSRMRLYRYELEYHQALTEYEKNLASLEAAVGRPFRREEAGR
ncbi:MAG: TolC family protein [Desulfobacterales bacterium]|nr:MAG: TolC family protein [Desulfobacterales bacterium]